MPDQDQLPAPSPAPQLDSTTISRLVENQSRDLALKARQIELEEQKDKRSFDYAKTALDKEAADRMDHRRMFVRVRRETYIFVAILVLISAGLIGLLAMHDKDELAKQLIEKVALLTSGAVGGYFYGKSKGASEKQSQNDDSDDASG